MITFLNFICVKVLFRLHKKGIRLIDQENHQNFVCIQFWIVNIMPFHVITLLEEPSSDAWQPMLHLYSKLRKKTKLPTKILGWKCIITNKPSCNTLQYFSSLYQKKSKKVLVYQLIVLNYPSEGDNVVAPNTFYFFFFLYFGNALCHSSQRRISTRALRKNSRFYRLEVTN